MDSEVTAVANYKFPVKCSRKTTQGFLEATLSLLALCARLCFALTIFVLRSVYRLCWAGKGNNAQLQQFVLICCRVGADATPAIEQGTMYGDIEGN